ncbi:MAG: class I SAM-dependent methyltransferase [Opitutales bacterium]
MTPPSPRDEFLQLLDASVREGALLKLTLGKPRGADATIRNLFVRPVSLRGAAHYSFLWHHTTRDITRNCPPAEVLPLLSALIGTEFHSAHLFTAARMAQLEYNKKGEPRLTFGRSVTLATDTGHDHAKARLLPSDSQAWLHALGITTDRGVAREGMADKHRQIHKFVELLSHLVAGAPALGTAPAHGAGTATPPAPDPAARPLEIADMGCGKGYLTFATHDYFNLVAGRPARVQGIEARPELVDLCNRVARETGRDRLRFTAGTIQDAKLEQLDILIALHACDTATDDAIARGVAAGAALIVVAPCCQKELRRQLLAAPVLAPALRHGIFQERHAEFATDALRALLLEWAGYDTKVFEFISTEHTAKNLMIAATRRTDPGPAPEAAVRVRELAAFYGLTTQALARQLNFSLTSDVPSGQIPP